MQDHPNPPQVSRWPWGMLAGALMVGLLLCSCAAVALIPVFTAGGHETQTDRAFQVLFSALFALLGALILRTEFQLRRIGRSRSPVSFVRLFFASRVSFTFWAGLLLFGVALARLELPTQASPLNILFWAVALCWFVGELTLLMRLLLRPRRVRAPGRDTRGAVPGE